MKKLKYLFFAFFCFLFICISANAKTINMYLFYRESCPHCHHEMEFLDEYLEDLPNVILYKYEINTGNNRDIYKGVQELLNQKSTGVPYLVIGSTVIGGYGGNYTEENIKSTVNNYISSCYEDVVGKYLKMEIDDDGTCINENNSEINIPILGKVDAKKVSLPLIAFIIGLVDGFNPCAMWILIFLITLMFGMENKKKMWILGLTFILSSGLIYLLFMISWLNISVFINKINYFTLIVGTFACLFGIFNIYNYIKSLKSDTGCVVVSDNKRKSIMKRIRKILSEKYFILAVLGIIVLSMLVNVIELFCSLGLPVIFTQILSLNNLSSAEYILYMLIYIIFFLIDDLVIFIIAMKTLEIKAISNKYTKYSHLIGGLIMLLIGLLLIFKPEWLMFNFN